MRINVGILPWRRRAACASSRRPCAGETWPRGTATGTGRWWSSPARRDFDRDPRRSDRGRTRAARCESRSGRSQRRSASRATRWHRREWSAKPCRENPCGRAWAAPNAGRLGCAQNGRAGFRGRSAGRTTDKETDPSKKSRAICDRRHSELRIYGIRSSGAHPSTVRRRSGQGSCLIVHNLPEALDAPKSVRGIQIDKSRNHTHSTHSK